MAGEAADPRTGIEALQAAALSALRRVRSCVPGNVVKYTSSPVPRVEVQVARQPEAAGGSFVAPPKVPDVPVLFFSAGGWTLNAPPQPGDDVILLISERSIAPWVKLGTVHQPDGDDRILSLADALALPVRVSDPRAAALAAFSSLVRLGNDAGTAGLEWDKAGATARLDAVVSILLGTALGATHPVLKGDTVIAGMTAFTGAISTAHGVFKTAVPVPTTPEEVFLDAIGLATIALGLTLAGWPSAKVFTE